MFNITWITGMPRSGTNWFAQIFASSPSVRLKLCPLFSYTFKNALDETSTATEWSSFFNKVYHTESNYLDQIYLREQGAIPEFHEKDSDPEHLVIKSTRFHNLTRSILEKHSEIRFVAIVRNPCAAIHSWLTNPLEFPESEDPALQWRSGRCRKTGPGEFWGYDDWKKVTDLQLSLTTEYPDRFILVRYEDIVQNASLKIKELFAFLGISYTAQTENFLKISQSSHNNHKRAVFKKPKVKDRWKSEMNPEIVQEILDEIKGTSLEYFIKEKNLKVLW